MADVWIHWAQGKWLVTDDGMNLIDKVDTVTLRDVSFVVDPVGWQISKRRGVRKSHAWAVGQRCDPSVVYGEPEPLGYHPTESNQFKVDGVPVAGAAFMVAMLLDKWYPVAAVKGPRYGATEQRRVQQYGGIR